MPLWPRKLPRWYWKYQILRDQGKKPPWPAPIPNPEPLWAKARYLVHKGIAPKPTYTGFFAADGVFLRGPGGESEDVAAMDASGFRWVAGNIGDHPASAWDKIRLRCSTYNVSFIPWLRVKPGAGVDPVERVRRLAQTAQRWGSRALIVNLEDEAWTDFPPENAASVLAQENWRGETGCSTVGYPPISPDWKALGAVGLMQAFLNVDPRLLPADCVKRGKECGFVATYPTFGTYPAAHPWTAASYKRLWNGPFSVYVGDNIGADKAWKEWA